MPDAAPGLSELAKILHARRRWRSGELTAEQWTACLAWYRRRCEAAWLPRLRQGNLAPGELTVAVFGEGSRPVSDGDTLCCTCRRPDSPTREHGCHLELLPWVLTRAGWDVVLHGRRLIFRETVVVDAATGEVVTPGDYGWPA